ncbi:TetR family transcriptional regulator [Conexibacter stalactiti]|uniref:TetR family transcriptional regulator n=1 Tax=Conexibacter stalactiti TaxID=1940611 RepID=A0ABU4HIF3_9ACTN|nr:TetR family transcriptional regulator [Conexibacter stalactiti]MDW5593095.1 TetR family transcriptional regulator [Conexibacter stalactiti]MEC5033736.1 TetR family transcriptional regulator [Conexibacter stalactiti]
MASTPPAEPTSLRERKRAAAKARVVGVAIALFDRHGYNAVSVADICAAADIAERSFFRYFPAKEHVLLEPIRATADRMQAALAAAPPELSDRDVLDGALRDLARYMLADWERLAPYFRVTSETTAGRSSPLIQLADRERAMADQLHRRHHDSGTADWRTRLLVARGVAAYRVWLDDLRTTTVSDPLAHLDRILATTSRTHVVLNTRRR